jgi:hypothetical protein
VCRKDRKEEGEAKDKDADCFAPDPYDDVTISKAHQDDWTHHWPSSASSNASPSSIATATASSSVRLFFKEKVAVTGPASPAVGYSHLHQDQQKALIEAAFAKLKGFVLTK